MKMKSRKGLSILLALVLVFAISVTPAFATWPGFQNTNTNNGVTDVLVTTPVTTYDDLDSNWAGGINAPSVIDNGVSYTLYNGGYIYGTDGGARMQATTLSTASPVWNVQIDSTADNISQLSTPVLVGSDLYALTTGSTTLYSTGIRWHSNPCGSCVYPESICRGLCGISNPSYKRIRRTAERIDGALPSQAYPSRMREMKQGELKLLIRERRPVSMEEVVRDIKL